MQKKDKTTFWRSHFGFDEIRWTDKNIFSVACFKGFFSKKIEISYPTLRHAGGKTFVGPAQFKSRATAPSAGQSCFITFTLSLYLTWECVLFLSPLPSLCSHNSKISFFLLSCLCLLCVRVCLISIPRQACHELKLNQYIISLAYEFPVMHWWLKFKGMGPHFLPGLDWKFGFFSSYIFQAVQRHFKRFCNDSPGVHWVILFYFFLHDPERNITLNL